MFSTLCSLSEISWENVQCLRDVCLTFVCDAFLTCAVSSYSSLGPILSSAADKQERLTFLVLAVVSCAWASEEGSRGASTPLDVANGYFSTSILVEKCFFLV